MPLGAVEGFSNIGADGNALPSPITNQITNFGWEYVWHCHILSHEEMDMMHSLVFVIPPKEPTGLSAVAAAGPRVDLSWTDNSEKEAQFDIQRATNAAFTTGVTSFTIPGTLTKGNVTYQDTSVANNIKYWYRVYAVGSTIGDTQIYAGSPNGFPTMSANTVSNKVSVQIGSAPPRPANPTALTVTVQAGPQASLTWMDNATNETGFVIGRCTGAGCTSFSPIAMQEAKAGTGNVTYLDTTVTFGNSYSYRVFAINATNTSVAPTNVVSVAIPATPSAPTNFRISVAIVLAKYRANLTWEASTNPTNFTIQRATNSAFTSGLATITVTGDKRSLNTGGINSNTTYYYRIRANNSISGSSAWTHGLPFPIRTGN